MNCIIKINPLTAPTDKPDFQEEINLSENANGIQIGDILTLPSGRSFKVESKHYVFHKDPAYQPNMFLWVSELKL